MKQNNWQPIEEIIILTDEELRKKAQKRINENYILNMLTQWYNAHIKKERKKTALNSITEKPIVCLADYRNTKAIYGWKDGYNIHEQIYNCLLLLKKFLEKDLSNKTGITDPIKYMHHLHYVENLTFEEIYEIVKWFFNYNNFYSFKSLLTSVFSWKPNNKNIILWRTVQKEIESKKNLVKNILWWEKIITEFDRENYWELSPKSLSKITHNRFKILKILSEIWQKTEGEVIEIISSEKDLKQLSYVSITKIIQEILYDLWFKHIKVPLNMVSEITKSK